MELLVPPRDPELAFSSSGESDPPNELMFPPQSIPSWTWDLNQFGANFHLNTYLRAVGIPCHGDLHNLPLAHFTGHTPDCGSCTILFDVLENQSFPPCSPPKGQLELPSDPIEEEEYALDPAVPLVPTRLLPSSLDEAMAPVSPNPMDHE